MEKSNDDPSRGGDNNENETPRRVTSQGGVEVTSSKKSPHKSRFKKLRNRVRKTQSSVAPSTSGESPRRESPGFDKEIFVARSASPPIDDVIAADHVGLYPSTSSSSGSLRSDSVTSSNNDETLACALDAVVIANKNATENEYHVNNDAVVTYNNRDSGVGYDIGGQKSVYIDVSELFEKPNLAERRLNQNEGDDVTTTSSNGLKIKRSNSGSSFQYSDPYFPTLMQDSIRELALDSQFTDVTIDVQGHKFRCHRMILAASSRYFKAMFCNAYKERDQPCVTINGVDCDVMKVLIRYAYTSYLEVERNNVQTVLEAASLLQFTRVMEACANYFVGELSADNAPGFMELAHAHDLSRLLLLARLKCVTCFEQLKEKSDYVILSADLLESLICRNDVMVSNEEMVFELVMGWCEHEPEKRTRHLNQLLKHIKLPLIDPIYFVQNVETHSLIRNNSEVYDVIQEARVYHVTGDVINQSSLTPRHNSDLHQVFVVIGGCDKDDQFVNDVIVLDFQHKTRTTICQLPGCKKGEPPAKKWAEFACATWRNNIVISGGKETKKEAWMFDMTLRQWVELGNLVTARWRHRMVVCRGGLYAVGGYDGLLRVDSLEKYNYRLNRWEEMRRMREGVSSAAVCPLNGAIYVFGGGPSVKVSTDRVQVYDPATDSWSLSTPMPHPSKCVNATVLGGIVYVAGGVLKSILSYDPASATWCTLAPSLNTERASSGLTACNGKIFVVGGRDERGHPSSNISYYDPTTSSIRSECNLPTAISHHGCLTLHKYDQTRQTKHSTPAGNA